MRYAALGDSFTEGVGDERPDGTPRGWADLVATGLATGSGAPVRYANLAVRGRLLPSIVAEQVPAALDLAPPPTLVSLNGGGNDLLRPGSDVARLLALTELALRRFRDAGVPVVLLSGADPTGRLPFGRTVHRRATRLTDGVRELATRYRIAFVDAFGDAELRRPAYWSADRLHLGPAGHRRVAHLVLAALDRGVPGQPLIERRPDPPRSPLAEARYYREHVLPWVRRRLRGHSSGDGRPGKHTAWTTVEPAAGAGSGTR